MVHIRTQKTFFPKRENTSLCKDNHQNKHRNKKQPEGYHPDAGYERPGSVLIPGTLHTAAYLPCLPY